MTEFPPKTRAPHILKTFVELAEARHNPNRWSSTKLLTTFQKPQSIPQEKNPTHNQPLPPELNHCSRVTIQASSEIEIASFVFIDLQV
jgi:hypothetical protein